MLLKGIPFGALRLDLNIQRLVGVFTGSLLAVAGQRRAQVSLLLLKVLQRFGRFVGSITGNVDELLPVLVFDVSPFTGAAFFERLLLVLGTLNDGGLVIFQFLDDTGLLLGLLDGLLFRLPRFNGSFDLGGQLGFFGVQFVDTLALVNRPLLGFLA